MPQEFQCTHSLQNFGNPLFITFQLAKLVMHKRPLLVQQNNLLTFKIGVSILGNLYLLQYAGATVSSKLGKGKCMPCFCLMMIIQLLLN